MRLSIIIDIVALPMVVRGLTSGITLLVAWLMFGILSSLSDDIPTALLGFCCPELAADLRSLARARDSVY
jgi:hypothetical protein